MFGEIISDGQEIPYEIAEPGDGLAFCQYQPLTAKFVRDNAAELRELESFREATETMRRSELAASYLEEAGIAPPADSIERANLAVTYFLARLWDGCSDFALNDERFGAALEEVEQCTEPEAGEVEAIVPLIGFQAPVSRIELSGAAIVRADTVDAPPEAARGERPAGSAGEWQPKFLISARIALDDDGGLSRAGDRVARVFERVVTTLRLFQVGGVGLGPHGWVRVAGDRWRRIETGAGRPRSGGYNLSDEDIPELSELARTVAVHTQRISRMRRPLLRFESGLDRRGAVDALNDHLLGLRFLLEGEGPAGVGLPMRVAALASPGDERQDVKLVVERAIGLERELWSGEPAGSGGVSPSTVAAEIEELLRTILRRGVSAELGGDLRAAADETLITEGLAVGEGAASIASTSEWELETESADPGESSSIGAAEAFERFEAEEEPVIAAARPGREPVERPQGPPAFAGRPQPSAEPESEARERPEALGLGIRRSQPDEPEARDERPEPPAWLEEVAPGSDDDMQFPRRSDGAGNHLEELSKPPMEREEVRARVEYLFPRTKTDWTIGAGEPQRKAAAG